MIGAKVGGIIANKTDPVGFLSENTRMQLNLLRFVISMKLKRICF
ncbi:hypothetical protein [Pseudanabaena sp. UWO311]